MRKAALSFQPSLSDARFFLSIIVVSLDFSGTATPCSAA
jgi:hypothetical protein